MRLTAEQIAAALDGKKSGNGHWMARCPAHEERTPSFRISDRDGRVLVHCFGGCSKESVIEALRSRGLWGQPSFKQQREMVQRERKKEFERLQIQKHILDADRKSGRDKEWTEQDRLAAARLDKMFPKGAPPIDLGGGWVMQA